MIARLKSFGAFWYDFVIGDDWRVAVGVAASLGLTWIITANTSVDAWWILPIAVVVLLPVSLQRAIRNNRRGAGGG